MVMTLKELRRKLLNELKLNNLQELYADISIILMYHLMLDKTNLLLGDVIVTEYEYKRIMDSVDKLMDGMPVQYIVGYCEFMSLKFIVNRSVLIPRADTEILVEAVLDNIEEKSAIADFCCGSGCIGVSIAYYKKDVSVAMIDISEDALEITKKNAKLNNVSDKLSFINTDILKYIPEPEVQYDCVVSNPPYIKSEVIDSLDERVRNNEPRIALDGGIDGLIFYRRIAEKVPLREGGLLALEIGYDQGDEVSTILKKAGYLDIQIIKDLEARDRVVLATRRFVK